MEITIKGQIAKKLRASSKAFQKIELVWDDSADEDKCRNAVVKLCVLTRAECESLRDILQKSELQGTRVMVADITRYLRAAQEGVAQMTVRSVRQAAWLLEFFFAHLPHHMMFSRDAYEGGSYVGYYISDVEFRERQEKYAVPEHVSISLRWIDKDVRRSRSLSWYAEDVLGKTPDEILSVHGYVAETPVLMERLHAETLLYYEICEEIGRKYMARGLAKDDLDDATGHSTEHMYSFKSDAIRMDLFGKEAPVVVDIMSEKGDKNAEDRSGTSVDLYRWHPWNIRFHAPSEDELARHLEADEDTDFAPELQLPVHPLVPCYDLKRHARFRVHVNNLTAYVYRPEVASGLVIPELDRALIDLLIDKSSNTFQDIVEDKGQSMNILAGGPPGTGKTLTAEVFAEFKARPLYTVQCGQLGLDPQEIEKNLGVVLQRANRWDAILLLDEADVYVRRRGHDLQQNAIVGVFLRLLEGAQCILFMTTNLEEDVDDAIASRCIVKIGYDLPSAEAQHKIWRTIADLNRIDLPESTITAFVAAHPRISGRNVKNLLKLASFISARDGGAVDLEALEFALKYNPTAEITRERGKTQ